MKQKFDKYDLYVGLNDKDKKMQLIDTITAYNTIANMVANTFDGGTVSQANGIYKHVDDQVVIENTIRIEIILFDNSKGKKEIKEFVDTLKKVFNQESVAVQHSRVDSQLW